ncbi:MAG: di-trans,poly-cis-decaprenylcistransferase [Acidobacteriota bacterium]|nr:di-trans,poly-cis-decaprenylcistransferase [Acidobacteriota bacterium]
MPDPRFVTPPNSLERSSIPAHVAIVMDGNGRWAQRRGLARTEGHAAGETALVDTTYGALSLGVKALTVYAFSTENWRRPVDEVRFLMNFNKGLLERRQHELHEEGVRIVFSGRRDWRVPKGVAARMDEARELTKKNKVMTLNIAFNYGGRAEIVDAIRELMTDGLSAKDVDEAAIRRRLYHPELPDPDLVVRTSGEFRTSNFLLWEMAYSELVFTDVLWPDFRREDLFDAIGEYQRRERRFGGLDK